MPNPSPPGPGGRHRSWALWALPLVFLAGAELTARVDDLVRLGIPLLAVPNHAVDLTVRDSFVVRGKPFGWYRDIRLNAAGFRGPPISRQAPQGCVRVMILGASESVGQPGKDYPSHLQDSLAPHGCFEVQNAAMGGQHLAQITQLWAHWGWRWSPDVAVVYATPPFYLLDKPPAYRLRRPPWPERPSRLTPRVLGRLTEGWSWPAPLEKWMTRRSIAVKFRQHPPGWAFRELPADRLALFQRHLDSVTVAIQAAGARPILVTHAMRFPDPPEPEDETLLLRWGTHSRATIEVVLDFERATNDALRRIARERGAMVVDAAALMNGRREWFIDFSHFTPTGAAVLAGVLADSVRVLVKEGPAPALPAARTSGRGRSGGS